LPKQNLEINKMKNSSLKLKGQRTSSKDFLM